ncbi:Protein ENHANCED DISEASE RESISTANCE 2, C-terminal [Dillenia turbinata]|uniref:Protein ENHANCED DISEASE RESISTANCE 2, C-terminal n=1 Tax=Dillenia turbinata TaxID=194707 RepID=A0AAN8YTJ1_9MAGN
MCPTKQKHRTKILSTNDEQDRNDYDWREETINGGSLRRVDLIAGFNGWASPPGNLFSLRSKQYLTKKIKSPAGEYLFKPTAVDWLKSSTRLDNVLGRSDNRVSQSLIKAHSLKKALKTFIFAVNLQVPGKDQYSAVFYFSTDEPIQPGSLLYRFINGDDQFRNQRFKLVNRIVKGPWIVKAAVGNYAACLLGKAVTCRYFRGENYLEIDVDIGSSAIARTIVHLAIGHVRSVTIDMGFVVEGQEVEELPEKLMGAVRICQMEMGSATVVEAEDAAAVAVGKSGCGGGSSKVNNHEEEEEEGDNCG